MDPEHLAIAWQRRCLLCVLRSGILREGCPLLVDLRRHLGPQTPCIYRDIVLSDLRKLVFGQEGPLTYAPEVYAGVSREAALAALRGEISG